MLNAATGSGDFPGDSFTLEWREGVTERQPPPTAWRSFRDARFERGQPLVDHVVIKTALGTADWRAQALNGSSRDPIVR